MTRLMRPLIPLFAVTVLLSAGGCINEAAQQRRAAAKAIDDAQIAMQMLPFASDAAADHAQGVLRDLRSIDVAGGALAPMKDALTAQAELVIGGAAWDAAIDDRREAARLVGCIEARLVAVTDLQLFIDHAPFRADQLGVDRLQQDAQQATELVAALQGQQAQIEQGMQMLQQMIDTTQQSIAEARSRAFATRTDGLATGGSDAIDQLERSGAMLSEIAPAESRLDELTAQMAAAQEARAQLAVIIEGQQATLEGIDADQVDIDAFVQARNAQIDAARAHLNDLKSAIAADAAALAALESGSLKTATDEVAAHYANAASAAAKAARGSRHRANPDRALDLGARQAELAVAVSRLAALQRAGTVFDQMASMNDLPDAGAIRDHARTIATAREAAVQQAMTVADAAMQSAQGMGNSAMAEAIIARLSTLQAAFAGRSVSPADAGTP
ncbi:MAG: hypothetical protein MK074_06870 [Phycisphaerales bacterium]|nr:hypothetical protein [Phycisphaerales bacterium]